MTFKKGWYRQPGNNIKSINLLRIFFPQKKKKILGRFCEKEKLLKEKKKEYHQTKFNYDENITVTILFIIET